MEYIFENISEYSSENEVEIIEERPPSYESALGYAPASGNEISRIASGVSKRRPGRQPATPDEHLDEAQFERRIRRRERNRVAAARCRNKRQLKIDFLEEQVAILRSEKDDLACENEDLKTEVERLKFQLTLQNTKDLPKKIDNCKSPRLEDLLPELDQSQYTVTFTPLTQLGKAFEFPILPETAVNKMRRDSHTAFNQFLQKML